MIRSFEHDMCIWLRRKVGETIWNKADATELNIENEEMISAMILGYHTISPALALAGVFGFFYEWCC